MKQDGTNTCGYCFRSVSTLKCDCDGAKQMRKMMDELFPKDEPPIHETRDTDDIADDEPDRKASP